MQKIHDYAWLLLVVGGFALKIWSGPWVRFFGWGLTGLYLLSWALLLYDGWRKTGSVRPVIKENSIEIISVACMFLLAAIILGIDSCMR